MTNLNSRLTNCKKDLDLFEKFYKVIKHDNVFFSKVEFKAILRLCIHFSKSGLYQILDEFNLSSKRNYNILMIKLYYWVDNATINEVYSYFKLMDSTNPDLWYYMLRLQNKIIKSYSKTKNKYLRLKHLIVKVRNHNTEWFDEKITESLEIQKLIKENPLISLYQGIQFNSEPQIVNKLDDNPPYNTVKKPLSTLTIKINHLKRKLNEIHS